MGRIVGLGDNGPPRRGGAGNYGRLGVDFLRPLLKRDGLSLVEVTVAAGVLLIILLLTVQLMGSLAAFWSREQARLDRSASGRLVMEMFCRHLGMAGYRATRGGLQVMEESAVAVEYLVGGAEERAEDYSLQRLYGIRQRDDRVMLTIQRRLPPGAGGVWSTGTSTELAGGVERLTFTFLDSRGQETAVPGEVRVAVCSLTLRKARGERGVEAFRTAVSVVNNRSGSG